MSESSPRMQWPYPSREDDPWYDFFQDFVLAVDSTGYGHREDRSIIWGGGGTLSWDLGSETWAWTDTISAYSPIGSRLLQIPAGSISGWAAGEVVYIALVRQPLENRTLALLKASQLPDNDNAMAVAVRIGDVVYFRTGISLGDGNTAAGIAPVPGGGGGSALKIEDEGATVTTNAIVIDFVGAGISASQTAPGEVEVNVPGKTLDVEDEGSSVESNASVIDFVGAGVTASQTAPGEVEVNIPGKTLDIEDEGSSVESNAVVIDFVGAGVTASQTAPGEVEVNIPGGGTSIFETDVPSNEIQPTTANIGRSFIVGSQDMNDSGAPNDTRMFFSKSEGVFRAGTVEGNEWDFANRGKHSFACGKKTLASGDYSSAEGYWNESTGYGSHCEGTFNYATGHSAHCEGYEGGAYGKASHSEGYSSEAYGYADHAEGSQTAANSGATAAYNGGAHAEGRGSRAYGAYGSHAEGNATYAQGDSSHSEGYATVADGVASHAEGDRTIATGRASHARGLYTEAVGAYSTAKGQRSVARHDLSEAMAGNDFSADGDGQNLRINAGTTTTDATPKELSLDYDQSSSNIALLDGASWAFTIRLHCRENTATGDCYLAIFEGIIQRIGTAVSLIPSSPLLPRYELSSAGASTWSSSITNDTGDDFNVVVTGQVATTIRWVAEIQVTEIIVAP